MVALCSPASAPRAPRRTVATAAGLAVHRRGRERLKNALDDVNNNRNWL